LIRSLFTGSRLALHVLWGLCLASLVALDRRHWLDVHQLAQGWSRHLLRILDIRLDVRGRPADPAGLTVANHISWLDIFALVACQRSRFVAKSEIRDWPVAGWLADALGTFYLRRGKGGARPLAEKLRPYLADGGSVVIFPEGTTTDGRDLRPFHPRLFSVALEAGVAIQPVALRYRPCREGRDLAPFVGDDDLFSHILRLLGARGIVVEVHYLAPCRADAGATRDTAASEAEQAVRETLFPGRDARMPRLPPAATPAYPSAETSYEAVKA
jgi:lyso-ornithine lipid O-acyltransferase